MSRSLPHRLGDQLFCSSSMAPVTRQIVAAISVIKKNASNIDISFVTHTPRLSRADIKKTLPGRRS
jgi:hypothetical protein